ncbi:MAG: DUF302 domain-containing protein [Xanthomonadales bacterium]|nr:DUF302 domain-containing protein [Xanthomonadales bacterium]
MKYIRKTDKTIDQATADLEVAVVNHNFGVLHIHDIQQTLQGKGVDLQEQCRVLEVCNPNQAKKVLDADMTMNMALPCRISVYSDKGQNYIGMILPGAMLGMLSDSDTLAEVAREVEEQSIKMIDDAI